jgi:hypothetical protein
MHMVAQDIKWIVRRVAYSKYILVDIEENTVHACCTMEFGILRHFQLIDIKPIVYCIMQLLTDLLACTYLMAPTYMSIAQ